MSWASDRIGGLSIFGDTGGLETKSC